MPDIRELGQLVKRKYPGAYDAIDDAELGRRVKAKYPGAYDQFADAPTGQNFLQNAATGAASGYLKLNQPIEAASDAISNALTGNFEPLKELVKGVGLGAGQLYALSQPGGAPAAGAIQARIDEADRQRQQRQFQQGNVTAIQRATQQAQLEKRAAQDPSLSGRITRGAVSTGVQSLPYFAAGGSPLATAAVGALSELGEPSNIPLAAGLGFVGGPGAKAASSALGKGAAEILETEGVAAARGVQQVLPGFEGIVEANVAKSAARSPWQDTVLAYYRANLLTNPAGRASDLGSTLINQFADAAARPIAAAVDVIVSKGTGSRAITGPSLTGTARAFGSIKQGLKDTAEVLRTGRQAIESGAEGAYSNEMLSGLGKVADVPVNGVFRILGALDAPFRRFGFARNLFDRARVAAINESKRDLIPPGQMSARIRELLDDPDIVRAAVLDGERAVLSEPNAISSWLASQTHASPNARLAIGLVQPFMRIPLNAVLKAADFAGLGGIKAMYKIARGVGRKARGQSFFRDLEDQRVFAQNVATGSFAPAAFILGMELEERGKLEGYYYTSKRDFPNGKVPTSINIGGQNYDINRLGGFIAAPLFVGATYNRLRKQNADRANALLRSFSGLVQTAPSLGYYGVPAKAGRLLTADNPGDVILQEAGSTVSGFIPASGAMGFAAKAIDTEQRRQTPGFLGPIESRLPGLRQRLPVKQGRQQKRR